MSKIIAKYEMKIINITLLVVFNLCFWIADFYPKHILFIYPRFHIALIAFLLNVIFFFLYYLLLIIAFEKETYIFSVKDTFDPLQPFAKRFHLKKIFCLIGIHIVFDVVRLSLQSFTSIYYSIFCDMLTIINWILVYYILVNKEKNIFNNKKSGIITIVSITLISIVFLVLNLKDISTLNYWQSKLMQSSTDFAQITNNLDFFYQTRNMLLDTVLGTLLYLLHTIKIPCQYSEQRGFILRFILRMHYIIPSLIILTIILKLSLFPYNNLCNMKVNQRGSHRYNGSPSFNLDYIEMILYRNNSNGEQYPAYKTTKYTVKYDNKKVKSFSLLDADDYEGFDFDDVIIYRNNVICYVENDKIKTIAFEDIASNKKDDKLISICKKQISSGNLRAFEYAAKYLCRYDSDFIKPYIQRIANGNFSAAESEFIKNKNYRKEFYVSLANKLLVNFE